MGFRSIVYIIEIAVPFFVDALCGHVWGLLAAIANLVAWLYFGIRSRMAPGTMMLWVLAIVYVVLVAVVQFAKLFGH